MTVAGVCLVRDAEDIIGPVVGHMLAEVDVVIVADNLSTDGTRSILDTIAAHHDRLVVLNDDDPAHRQGSKTTALAHQASRDFGAAWVVPFDSDEVWYSPFGRIGTILEEFPAHVFIAAAELYDHVATTSDPTTEPNPLRRLGWRRRAPGPFGKVAVRVATDLVISEGNHNACYATGFDPPACAHGRLVVRHFPYRSPEQMIRKATVGAEALRAASELPDSVGRHWRDYDALGPDGVREAFFGHFHSTSPEHDPFLIYDPAPLR